MNRLAILLPWLISFSLDGHDLDRRFSNGELPFPDGLSIVASSGRGALEQIGALRARAYFADGKLVDLESSAGLSDTLDHRGDRKSFVVRADEKLTAFVELESTIRSVSR